MKLEIYNMKDMLILQQSCRDMIADVLHHNTKCLKTEETSFLVLKVKHLPSLPGRLAQV